MMYTTLNKIREYSPCTDGWNKLLKHLGKSKADDEQLPFLTILESNGLDDALWCLRSTPEYDRESRLFAVWCALQVKHLMKDERSLNALVVAEKYANGLATNEELLAAWAAAEAAAWDAAEAAEDAAWDAAWATAEAAACNAAGAAEAAACNAAGAAAWDAAGAAWDAAGAAWNTQKEVFVWIVSGGFAKWEKEEL